LDLTDYGFSRSAEFADSAEHHPGCIPARITAVYKGRFELICEYGEGFGRLKPGVYYGGQAEEFPTVGDFVLIHYLTNSDSLIVKTLPRRTYFLRRSPGSVHREQAVAANFDIAFLVQSLNANFNLKRLERYLTLTKQSGAVPVILLTKADLTDDFGPQLRAAEKISLGAAVCVVSTKTGFGLDRLAEFLKPRTTAVLLGSSGVGKSSLINALTGEETMSVGEIRERDERGRHTTTHRELILLKNGAMMIDTPGMRALGMWDISRGLDEAFADVEQFLGNCRFSDCKHQNEPGCAIQAAIAAGELSPERWKSYLALKREAERTFGRTGSSHGKREAALTVGHTQKRGYRRTACIESIPCKDYGAKGENRR
jgi:ribosome biogenesis GTPase